MRGVNSSFSSNTKLMFFCFFFLGIAYLIRNSTLPYSNVGKTQNCPSSCNKLPTSVSSALVHYATTDITPQQTLNEISVAERVLRRKSPCNFLVFGLGHDSLMWASLNHGGRTVFLEEDPSWIRQMTSKFPTLESHLVTYDTKVRHADKLLTSATTTEECYRVLDPRESNCTLALQNFPKEIYNIAWDLIMVDAPTGYHDEAPGRMSVIYTAGLLGRNRDDGETDVFVHDVDRYIEDKFSTEFLCEGYLVEQVEKLRRFTIPSHKTRLGRPFCAKSAST